MPEYGTTPFLVDFDPTDDAMRDDVVALRRELRAVNTRWEEIGDLMEELTDIKAGRGRAGRTQAAVVQEITGKRNEIDRRNGNVRRLGERHELRRMAKYDPDPRQRQLAKDNLQRLEADEPRRDLSELTYETVDERG